MLTPTSSSEQNQPVAPTVSQKRDLKLVKVIYIDEAGASFEEPVFTWAAVIIKDYRWRRIERDAERIIELLVPSELQNFFEFHAYDIFSGNGVWARWRNAKGKALRFQILSEFVNLIRKHRVPIVECSWRRGHERDPVINKAQQALAFSVCVDSVEHWFIKNAKYDVGMLISDIQGKRSDEAIYKQDIRRARRMSRLSRSLGALRHIVDTIHFADSHESIGLQLADACAFFIKRHQLVRPNDEAEQFFKLLEPRIYRGRQI